MMTAFLSLHFDANELRSAQLLTCWPHASFIADRCSLLFMTEIGSFFKKTILQLKCGFIHRRTQDFTMEGFHVVEGRARELGGQKSPQWGPGAKHPKAEAKCEISVNV